MTGPATLIEAIAAGQRAARAIDVSLGGTGELPPDVGLASRRKPPEEEGELRRSAVRMLSREERQSGFAEVVAGYSAQEACCEASRCLRCDLEK